MWWTLSLKILELVPVLIEALIISLIKRVDFIPDLQNLSWWEVLVEESIVKLLSSVDGVGW